MPADTTPINTALGPPLTLDEAEASYLLGVPADTLKNQTRMGNITCVMVGKHRRWMRRDLVAYLQNLGDQNGET